MAFLELFELNIGADENIVNAIQTRFGFGYDEDER